MPTLSAAAVADAVTRDAFLAQAVQASADALFCQNTDGVLTTWNPAAERIFGWSAEEVLGRRTEALLPDQTRDELARALQDAA